MNGTASVHLRFCEGALLAAIAGTAFPWDAEVALGGPAIIDL